MSKQEERPNEITFTLLEYLVPKECAIVIENNGKYVNDIEYENIILDERLEELEKALDKACEILEFNDKSGYCYKPKTKEQWKAWLMKDEK